jgi:hypothetical protein
VAWTVSGLFVANWIDILDATQLAIDTSLTSHKWALYLTAKTPNYSTDVSYNTTSETTNTGGAAYTAGGKVITGLNPTTTESPAGTLKYDHDDISWPSATFSAEGGELYADALAADNLIVGMWFGSSFTATNGTFTIQFAAGGIFTIDLTP